MSEAFSLAGEGVAWIQPDGPNTEPKVLACHMVDTITEPKGDITTFYCPDPAIPNKFNVKGSFQGAPGAITFTIETDLLKTADYLEKVKCPVPIYLGKVSCGRKNQFSAYDRMFVMENSWISNKTVTKMVASAPDNQDRTKQTFDVSTEIMLRAFQRKAVRQAIAETEALNAVTTCSDFQCAGDCGAGTDVGENLFVGGDTLAGSPVNTSDVWETADAGATWTLAPSDPFAGGEIISTIQCVKIDRDTVRVIVGRGTTDAGNPAEIAYSDDGGVTWTYVDVGTVDGQYFMSPNSIFVYDYYNIYAVTTGGYIYKSSDGGVTWVAQSEADVTAQNLYAIHFVDTLNGYACGAANVILATSDGGSTWYALTGPAAQAGVNALCVWAHTKNKVWVSYGDGDLYYTVNGGTTWNLRTHPVTGSGTIPVMSWFDEYVGAFIHNTAAPVGTIYWTINGGYTWENVPLSEANSGLNDIVVIDENTAFIVGEADGGTAMIYKVTGG